MGYIEVKDFQIMKVGKTENGLIITEDAIDWCLERSGFDNAPILNNEGVCIGFIKGDVDYEFVTGSVTATVLIDDEFSNKISFDNWEIEYSESMDTFKYRACILFSN